MGAVIPFITRQQQIASVRAELEQKYQTKILLVEEIEPVEGLLLIKTSNGRLLLIDPELMQGDDSYDT